MKIHKSLVSNYLSILAVLICVLVLPMGFISLEDTYSPGRHTVTIFKMKFNPENLVVNKGDTVVWINKDFYQHDVSGMTNQKWRSDPLNKGDQYSRVIKQDLKYFCNLHKVMKGTITVNN